jgi:hypothetical protein
VTNVRLVWARRALLCCLVGHLLLGLARLPGRVLGRRFDEVAAYRRDGAARHLLGSARLGGAEAIEWLQQNVPSDTAVLWRWPADGALEFVAALIAPRLLVDERQVPVGATTCAGRTLARGTLPDGSAGLIVVQGTPDGGLVLRVRER